MGVVLGIDVSTTATKAVLVDPAGAIVGIGSADLAVSMPRPLWSEQDPEAWWTAAQVAIGAVLVVALSLWVIVPVSVAAWIFSDRRV